MSSIVDVVEADLTLYGGKLQPGIRVALGADGRIVEAGHLERPAMRRLRGRMLLPGFVNAHSHAFQRGLRGRGEVYDAGHGDFWSWREAMYSLVNELDRASFKQVCRRAFEEMVAAGFTTVGEFHYLHHGDPDAGDFAFDEVVLEAAQEADIRVVLLCVYYAAGNIGQPLSARQARFATPDVDGFLRQVDRLAGMVDRNRASVGIAPHSIRAVPTDDLKRLFAAANERGMVVHMHLEEQLREIDDCHAALRAWPLEWVLEHCPVDHRFTAVHLTHTPTVSLEKLLAAGGNVCVCPITEASLGDGIADVPTMMSRKDAVSIGSDSNVRVDPLEELRWLEGVQRLHRQHRGVCQTHAGDVGLQLLRVGTENGARALGVRTGHLLPGYWADLVALALDEGPLADVAHEGLLAGAVFGAGREAVREVCVGGRWRA